MQARSFAAKLVALSRAASRRENIWVYGDGNGKTSLFRNTYISKMCQDGEYARFNVPDLSEHEIDTKLVVSRLYVECQVPPPPERAHLFSCIEFVGVYDQTIGEYV